MAWLPSAGLSPDPIFALEIESALEVGPVGSGRAVQPVSAAVAPPGVQPGGARGFSAMLKACDVEFPS